MSWLRENGLNLLVTFGMICIALGGFQVSNNWRDSRLTEGESTQKDQNKELQHDAEMLIELRAETIANTANLAALTTKYENTVQPLSSNVAVLSSKVDQLTNAINQLNQRLDQRQTRNDPAHSQ